MKSTANTISSAVNYFKDELNSIYDASELEQIMHLIFSFYFKIDRVDLVFKANDYFSQDNFTKFKKVIAELKTNKPLAQIIGEWEFYDLILQINEHTLIPRPETEELVQLIINDCNQDEKLSILDVGTGTGCIALALKKSLPESKITAFDISDEALKVAKSNADRNKLDVNFKKINILDTQNLTDKFNVIVSNPPYIPNLEKKLMNKNVLDYEPHLALFVEDNEPLIFYKSIAEFANKHLKKNGALYFEVNEKYGNEVINLLKRKNFTNIELNKDINNKDRIVKCNIQL